MKFKIQNRHEEDDEQAALIHHFAMQWPKVFPYLFAIPNGGKREIREAVRLKKAGVKPGVPDLFLAFPIMDFHGMFVEMKSKKGSASPDQKKFHKMLQDKNFHVVVCRSSTDAMYEFTRYLGGYAENLPRKVPFVIDEKTSEMKIPDPDKLDEHYQKGVKAGHFKSIG